MLPLAALGDGASFFLHACEWLVVVVMGGSVFHFYPPWQMQVSKADSETPHPEVHSNQQHSNLQV